MAHDHASWWRRVAARLIDGAVILPACALPFVFLVAGPTRTISCHSDSPANRGFCEVPSDGTILVSALLYLGVLAGILVYLIALDGSPRGATLGKRAVGIRVADLATGGPIGPARAAGRVLVQVPMALLTCGVASVVDVLWPLWDGHGQTVHDKIVASTVVRA